MRSPAAAPPLPIADGLSLATSLALYMTAVSKTVVDPTGPNYLIFSPGLIAAASVQVRNLPGPLSGN